MASSPRHYAEQLLEEFRRLAREERSPGAFLDLAEQTIREAVAFELNWLAEFLAERAKREGPQQPKKPAVRPAPAEQLRGGSPSLPPAPPAPPAS